MAGAIRTRAALAGAIASIALATPGAGAKAADTPAANTPAASEPLAPSAVIRCSKSACIRYMIKAVPWYGIKR